MQGMVCAVDVHVDRCYRRILRHLGGLGIAFRSGDSNPCELHHFTELRTIWGRACGFQRRGDMRVNTIVTRLQDHLWRHCKLQGGQQRQCPALAARSTTIVLGGRSAVLGESAGQAAAVLRRASVDAGGVCAVCVVVSPVCAPCGCARPDVALCLNGVVVVEWWWSVVVVG
jgi:hypothetical protein